MPEAHRVVIDPEALDTLVGSLRARGYRVLGPAVQDGAIVCAELETAGELPTGWTDRHDITEEVAAIRATEEADRAGP